MATVKGSDLRVSLESSREPVCMGVPTLLLKEALEKAKRDAKVLKTSFLPPVRKGHAVEAIASSQLSCI